MKTLRLLEEILSIHAEKTPDKTALICENQRLTYAELERLSDRLGHALHAQGVQTGERILLYLFNSVELVVGMFGALKANAVFSVVDYANTAETLTHIAQDCQATALITHPSQAALVQELFHKVPSLRFAILTGNTPSHAPGKLLSWDALLKVGASNARPTPTRIDSDLAYLIYTSGSTGKAKGVRVTHRSCLFTIHSGIEFLGLVSEDVHVSPLPLSFSPGINQLFQTLRAGATLVLEKSFAFPTFTLQHMQTERATGFAAVPTILAMLLQYDLSRYDLRSLRYITTIGAALPPTISQKVRLTFPEVALFSTYGMAEASYSLGLPPNYIDALPTSVGRPFPGTQAWIVDEAGNRVPPGEIGELVLRGGHVRSGYWNASESMAKRFRPAEIPGELLCYTGDMFRMDEQGFFYFVGRGDEIIKSGAKKIALKEIEYVLYQLDGVLDAAAIGIPDPLLGTAVKAFVLPAARNGKTLTVEKIQMHCRQHLEPYKVPSEIVMLDHFPKTPSGKIIKTHLV